MTDDLAPDAQRAL